MVTGSGTSGDPYMLYNLTDLESISTLGLNKYYKLANDIDASATQGSGYNSGAGWLPIGTFTGNFNGNNYSILGLYINRPTTDSVGFFSIVGACSIYNITLKEDSNGNGNIIGRNNVGGLIGYVTDRTPTFTNCNVYMDINGVSYVGGVIGYIHRDYAMYSCNYSGTITATGSYVGGITGGIAYIIADSRPMDNCNVEGEIIASGSYVGGLVGDGHSTLFTNNVVTKKLTITVSSTSDYVGGICGRSYNHCYFNDCINKIDISGRDYVGGICGSASNYNGGQFNRCYSTGNISGRSYIGGISGRLYGSDSRTFIKTSFTLGTITSTGNYVGGITGYCTRPIESSYSIANIVGVDSVGGLVGRMESSTLTYCYSKGAVSGSTNVGGLVGYKNTGTATSCYWDTQTSGQASSALGTGETTANMKLEATYTSWDFSTPIWVIDSYQNDSYPYLDDILPDPWNVYASDLAMSGEQVNIPERINLNDSATSEEQSLISFKGFQLIDNGVDSNLVSILNNFTLNDSGTINESITFLKNLEDNCSSFETVYSYFYSLINDSNISSESLQLLNTFLLTDSRTSEENIILMKRIEDSGISDESVNCDVSFLITDSGTSEEIASCINQLSLLERRRMLESVLKIENDFTLTEAVSAVEEPNIANVRYVGDEVNSDVQVYVDVTAVYHVVELVDDVNSTEKINLIVRLSERDEREEFLTSLKGIHPEEE